MESVGGTVELEAPKITTLVDDDVNLSLTNATNANGSILQDDDDDDDMVLDAADEMEAKKVDPWEQQKKELIASIPAQLGPRHGNLILASDKAIERFEQLGRNYDEAKGSKLPKCDE